ncbi:MAG: methionine--tRNA ligase [Acidimicrobiia bacterium]
MRYYVTTAIPYVNGAPHVGHALGLIEVDVLARFHRMLGDETRSQSGTDDNALKNVQSAEAQGMAPGEYVAMVAENFQQLAATLDITFDDFVKTGSDPRHAPAVEKIWNACAASGDFYRKSYEGLYCQGCEAFYGEEELTDGKCPEHGVAPELVHENNYFFRLSKYQDQLHDLISRDVLKVSPESRKREVLAFIERGLEDFSTSRSMERARGWGIPVPGDPEQVIYVWFDALTNYITGPGYGTDDTTFDYWWDNADARVHVIGKGILRFHTMYWPAMLLSAGVKLPTQVFIHEYLTANGAKIGKSTGNSVDPVRLVEQYGSDALRWWMTAEVGLAGDTDFTEARLVARANEDLANNLGNLVNRTVSMVNRYRDGAVPALASENAAAGELRAARDNALAAMTVAMDAYDFRRAAQVVTDLGDIANRYVEDQAPWALAKAEKTGADPAVLDAVLAELVVSCRAIAQLLEPFTPKGAAMMRAQLGDGDRVGTAEPIFRKLELSTVE